MTAVENVTATPAGKTRRVNRATFTVKDDPRLGYLITHSQWRRRRNPQTTIQVRDLPDADRLLADTPAPVTGTVSLGPFVLTVFVLPRRYGNSPSVPAWRFEPSPPNRHPRGTGILATGPRAGEVNTPVRRRLRLRSANEHV